MVKLISKYNYEHCPEQAKKRICNGCGEANSWKSRFVPETIYGLNIRECCNIHDYMYYFGVSEYGKIIADNVFLENMYILIKNASWWLRYVRRRRAKKYYLAVKWFGQKAYMSNKEGFNNNIDVSKKDLNEWKEYTKQELKKIKNK